MAVARVTEISATSPQSFEDAIRQGLERATKTLRGVTAAWIKDQRVKLENGQVTEYQVNMEVTFVLEGSRLAQYWRKASEEVFAGRLLGAMLPERGAAYGIALGSNSDRRNQARPVRHQRIDYEECSSSTLSARRSTASGDGG